MTGPSHQVRHQQSGADRRQLPRGHRRVHKGQQTLWSSSLLVRRGTMSMCVFACHKSRTIAVSSDLRSQHQEMQQNQTESKHTTEYSAVRMQECTCGRQGTNTVESNALTIPPTSYEDATFASGFGVALHSAHARSAPSAPRHRQQRNPCFATCDSRGQGRGRGRHCSPWLKLELSRYHVMICVGVEVSARAIKVELCRWCPYLLSFGVFLLFAHGHLNAKWCN